MDAFPQADRLVEDLEALKSQLSPRSYVVVATFGGYDEAAIEAALDSQASYVGLVASQKRMASIVEFLQEQGVPAEQLQRLQRPVGLPGRALRPAEIALSVSAALVEVRRTGLGLSLEEVPAPREEAIDPICGMTVDIVTAMYKTERHGQMYYFCCAGCQAKFEAS
jgi:xanthine dehydrogenase accessory factor